MIFQYTTQLSFKGLSISILNADWLIPVSIEKATSYFDMLYWNLWLYSNFGTSNSCQFQLYLRFETWKIWIASIYGTFDECSCTQGMPFLKQLACMCTLPQIFFDHCMYPEELILAKFFPLRTSTCHVPGTEHQMKWSQIPQTATSDKYQPDNA